MSELRIPKELYTKRGHLFGAMKQVASNFDKLACSVEEIIRLLPQNLKEAPAFKDALTGKWRYDFGDPYSIENGKEELFGTDQCPLVEWLFRCVSRLRPWCGNAADGFPLAFCCRHVDDNSTTAPGRNGSGPGEYVSAFDPL